MAKMQCFLGRDEEKIQRMNEFANMVNAFYYRIDTPTKSMKAMRAELADDAYNMHGSERSGQNIINLLFSLGRWRSDELDSKDAVKFREMLMTSDPEVKREIESELSNLEHYSWSAWLICNGRMRFPTAKEMSLSCVEKYKTEEDWLKDSFYFEKKKDGSPQYKFIDKVNKIHPVLVASYYPLDLQYDRTLWDKKIDELEEILDPLDRMSVIIRNVALALKIRSNLIVIGKLLAKILRMYVAKTKRL